MSKQKRHHEPNNDYRPNGKGPFRKKVAEKLKIAEPFYKEIELGISPLNIELAEALETLYNCTRLVFHYLLLRQSSDEE